MTVMKNEITKNENASERAVALMQEALDVMRRTERAPDSPVNTFLTSELRRKCRRAARLLREQKAEPRYKNLHSAEELADIYERAVERDEIRAKGKRDLQRISLEIERIRKTNAAEVDRAMMTFVGEAARLAEEEGPGSEAAERFRLMQFLGWFGQQARNHSRKSRTPLRWCVSPSGDPSIQVRLEMSAAEVLDSPPPEEAVIAFPPEGEGSGRPRVYLRIGIGEGSWVGSFETGDMNVGTVCLMPGDKHLFVSAKGAGYIIDLESRTLAETTGTRVAAVTIDGPRSVMLVDHDGTILEAFGSTGRLWKTLPIGSGGFQQFAITDTSITGEARDASGEGWTPFSVELATGEVRFGEEVEEALSADGALTLAEKEGAAASRAPRSLSEDRNHRRGRPRPKA
jgi:hypothetical protein